MIKKKYDAETISKIFRLTGYRKIGPQIDFKQIETKFWWDLFWGVNVVIFIKTRPMEPNENFFEKNKNPPVQVFLEYCIPKVMLLIFRVGCGTLNSNQSEEYDEFL